MALQRVPNLSIHSLTQSLNQVLLVSCRTCCILAWVFSQTRRQIVASANAIVSACVTLHMQRKRTICWLDSTRLVKGEWNKSLAWHLNGIRVTEVMAWILFIILSICEPWKGSRRRVCLSVCLFVRQPVKVAVVVTILFGCSYYLFHFQLNDRRHINLRGNYRVQILKFLIIYSTDSGYDGWDSRMVN